MDRIVTRITVANNVDVRKAAHGVLALDAVRRVELSAVISGRTKYLVLPESVGKQLGLPNPQSSLVRFADGRIEFREMVEEARVDLAGRHGTFRAILEPHRTDALIGAIILYDLDLLVDCSNLTLYPRDPKQITSDV